LLTKTPPGGITGETQEVPIGFAVVGVFVVIVALWYIIAELQKGEALRQPTKKEQKAAARKNAKKQ
jgi:hypothetical protein